jgi:hypothetical protein
MSSIDEACREIVDSVDGAVACGVVDLNSGRLLGSHCPDYGQVLKDALAAATMDLVGGRATGRIERSLATKLAGSGGDPRLVQEVHVMSGDNYHVARVLKGGQAAVMLVTNRATNVGMGSAQMKAVIPKVEPHLR